MTNLSTAILEEDNDRQIVVCCSILPNIRAIFPDKRTTLGIARQLGILEYFVPFPAALDQKDKIKSAVPYVVTREVVDATVNYECTKLDAIRRGMAFVQVPNPTCIFEHTEAHRYDSCAREGFPHPRATPAWENPSAKLGVLVESNDPRGRTGSLVICASPEKKGALHRVTAHELKFDFDNPNYADEHQANWPQEIINGKHGFLFQYCYPVLTPQMQRLADASGISPKDRAKLDDWGSIGVLAAEWPFVVALLQIIAARRRFTSTLVVPDDKLNKKRNRCGKPGIRNYFRLTLTIHLAGKPLPLEDGPSDELGEEPRVEQRPRRRRRHHNVMTHTRTLKTGRTVQVQPHERCRANNDDHIPQSVRILKI